MVRVVRGGTPLWAGGMERRSSGKKSEICSFGRKLDVRTTYGGQKVLQAGVLLLCGMVAALIGGRGGWQRVCLATATFVMLVIGVMVQRQFWDALPAWHHWIFFLLILAMMPVGGVITHRLQGKRNRDAAVR